MKLQLLAFIFCSVGLATSQSPRRDNEWPPPELRVFLKPVHTRCVEKTGVSEDAIKSFSDGDTMEGDEKLKCYMSCSFHEAQIVDEAGELHLEKMIEGVEMLGPEVEKIFLEMGKRCLRTQGESQCDRAFWYNKCWKQSDPKHYFLI